MIKSPFRLAVICCFLMSMMSTSLSAQQPDTISLDASQESGTIGDTVCVAFTVSNFEEVIGFQFPVIWDPTYLDFVEITDRNSAIDFRPTSIGLFNVDQGLINVLHFDPTLEGFTVPDGSTLFEACFEITGPPGADNPIRIQNHPDAVEFIFDQTTLFPVDVTNGFVTIEPPADPSWVHSHCNSRPDSPTGTISATIFEPSGTMSFEWIHETNGEYSGMETVTTTGQTVSPDALIAGSYQLELTTSDGTVVLQDSIAIDSTGPFAADFYHSDPSCPNANDGLYGIQNISGGQSPYFYRWTGDNFLFEELIGLSNGTYTSTVKDAGGCVLRDTAEVVTELITLQGTVTGVSCEGSSDGSVSWSISGGTPYDGGLYNIFLNNSFVDRDSVIDTTGLSPSDTLRFVITDSLVCSMDSTVIVPPGRTLTFDSTAAVHPSCFDLANGSLSLKIETEGPSYPPYEAQTGPNISDFTLQNGLFEADGLDEGTYSITITDQGPGSCPIDTSFSLIRPDTLRIQLIDSMDDDCTDTAAGLLHVRASGGSAGDSTDFDYQWNNGATGPLNDSILSGQYSVTVTDTLGCQQTANYRIDNDEGPVIDSLLVSDVLCFGDSNGTAEIQYIAGDTTPVNVLWGDGTTDSLRAGLAAGTYPVTIQDPNGCMAFATAEIEQPDSLSFTTTTSPEVDTMMNGSVDLEITGGTSPYTVEWFRDSVLIDPFLPDSLSEGTYTYIITDANGCTIADSVFIDGIFTDIERPGRGNRWSIYPNPAREKVTLNCMDCSSHIIRLQLVGVDGTVHYSERIGEGTVSAIEIPVSHCTPGLYFLKWQVRGGYTGVKKMIIQEE